MEERGLASTSSRTPLGTGGVDSVNVTRTWAVLILAMILPFVASLFYFVWLGDYGWARVVYGMTKGFTLVWPLLAVRLVFREPWPRFQALDGRHRRAIPLGVMTGAAIVGAMYGLMMTPVGDVVMGSAEDIRAKTESLGILNHYWTFALVLSVAHSFLEEYYWRWFVYGRLRGVVPGGVAHGLAGVSFAAHHIVVTTQYFPLGWGILFGSMVGVGGMIWSWMYARHGTLAGCWVSHMAVDLGMLALGHRIIFGTYF